MAQRTPSGPRSGEGVHARRHISMKASPTIGTWAGRMIEVSGSSRAVKRQYQLSAWYDTR
jgi:hypothetical protein